MRRGVHWLGSLALAAVLAGCLGAQSSPCADGRVCAPGTVCVAALDLCADPADVEACRNAGEGDRCVIGGSPTGTCTSGVCLRILGCGNGLIESGEACDDGNRLSGDGCNTDCLSTEICGNKVIDRGEQCDCGTPAVPSLSCPGPNSDTSGPCSVDCKLRCGDGVVSVDEECDPRSLEPVRCATGIFDRGSTTCSASCQPMSSATCGYIGWRTRSIQPSSMPIREVAPIGAGLGFYVAGNEVGTITNHVAAGATFVAGARLASVWAADVLTAVAVGEMGTIVRLENGLWMPDISGTSVDLRDVWGRASDDVYAIGDGTVLHWDGVTWSSLAPPPGAFRAVAGDAANVYVAGDQGTLLIYDGVAWSVAATGTSEDLRGVWSADGLVVAVGSSGTIVQNDGASWVRGRTSTAADLLSVWGSASEGFFATGEQGTLLFYDGRVWRSLAPGRGITGSPNQTFFSVAGVPGDHVGVIGTHDLLTYEGAAWSPTVLPTSQTITGLWGSGPDDVFAVGRNGTILHHDGLTWTLQPSSTTVDLHAVWGTAPDDVYAAGDALTLLHYDGASWTTVRTGPADGLAGEFLAVFAAAPGNVVIGGTTGLYHYNGAALVRRSPIIGRALWGTSTTNIFAAGAGIQRFDGSVWSPQPNPTGTFLAVSGTSPNDLFAVGPSSYSYNGSSWAAGPFSDAGLAAVSASGARGVFAAGQNGALHHWDRSRVELFVSRTTADLNALFMTGNMVFMAGADGTLDVMVFHH
jgi:cysteine-rich repeat protein